MRIESLLLLAVLSLGLGCKATTGGLLVDQYQVDSFLRSHPSLSQIDKECLKNRTFQIGMTQEVVEVLLGRPRKIEQIKTGRGQMEKHIYNRSQLGIQFMLFDENGILSGIE